MIDSKTAPVFRLKALSDSGEFEGYGSTFDGAPDSYGDVVAKGAFTDSLDEHKERGTMPKLLWQHDLSQPIGSWLEATENETGLLMRGRLNLDVQKGQEAHALLSAGDIDGLSIGYRLKEFSVDTETDVWTLEKIDLHEVSVVTLGANSNATIHAVKSIKTALRLAGRLKAGERLTEREWEGLLKGSFSLSNAEAERAVRVNLKQGQGEPARDEALEFLRAMAL